MSFWERRVFKLDFPSRDCFKIRHYFRRRTSQMEMKLPFEQRPWKKRAAQEPSAVVGAYGTECNPLLIRLWYTQEPRQIFITVVISWRKAAFAKWVKGGDSRATAFPNQLIEIFFFSHSLRLRAQDWWARAKVSPVAGARAPPNACKVTSRQPVRHARQTGCMRRAFIWRNEAIRRRRRLRAEQRRRDAFLMLAASLGWKGANCAHGGYLPDTNILAEVVYVRRRANVCAFFTDSFAEWLTDELLLFALCSRDIKNSKLRDGTLGIISFEFKYKNGNFPASC